VNAERFPTAYTFLLGNEWGVYYLMSHAVAVAVLVAAGVRVPREVVERFAYPFPF
jgi:hypothetical protein